MHGAARRMPGNSDQESKTTRWEAAQAHEGPGQGDSAPSCTVGLTAATLKSASAQGEAACTLSCGGCSLPACRSAATHRFPSAHQTGAL